ncbi:hypothetical protein AcV5_000254 [Taiwanofungus camphoratus]|nr:hypothetical protein AcV5_000254 [Antrodia cinnamomea]
MMKHKKNQPTPQERYRARKQREEAEKEASLPPGLINHGNTCFMNSTLQGLMATGLLHNLVNFEPVPSFLHSSSGAAIVAKRSPQLTNGHGLGGQDEHPWVEGMPLGDIFIKTMKRAWEIQESRKRESMSPKDILFAIGRKYDQYMDFRQQDAHEFLRHMLDAMRMEELDIIKQRQPPPPKQSRRRSRKKRASIPSASLSDVSSSIPTPLSAPAPSSSSDPLQTALDTPAPIADDDKFESFVDMLFGGHLASILVCEKCKKVSLTYEDFNDLSLSIKPEDYAKGRKRDRLKSLARKLRGSFRQPGTHGTAMHRSSSVPTSPLRRSSEVTPLEEEPPTHEGPRRRSFDHVGAGEEAEEARDEVKELAEMSGQKELPSAVCEDEEESGNVSEEKNGKDADAKEKADGEQGQGKEKKEKEDSWGKIGRRLSVSMKMGRKTHNPRSPSQSVERGRKIGAKEEVRIAKGEESETSRASLALPSTVDSGSEMGDVSDSSRARRISPPISSMATPISALKRPPHIKQMTGSPFAHRRNKPGHGHAPKLSREEAAYLRRLLADIHPSSANPLSMLHQALAGGIHSANVPSSSAAAQAMWAKMGHLPGIEECLRMFTAVEILDGENMVGCHRCWKIANGTYVPRRQNADIVEEDEDARSESEESGSSPVQDEESIDTPKRESTEVSEPSSSTPDNSPSGRISPASTSAVSPSTAPSSDNLYDATSMSSAPTTVGSGVPHWTGRPTVCNADKESVGSPVPSPMRPATYGGLPIPSISTTAPESPLTPPASRDAGNGTDDKGSRKRPSSSLGVSPSDDSLLTPRARRFQKPKRDSVLDESSESSDDEYESDVSAGTSVYSDNSSIASPSGSPAVSPRTSAENLRRVASPTSMKQHKAPDSQSPSKTPRSKQVILRRMYKRYLIATPPPILVVHLKRFQQTNKTHTVSFSGAGGVKKLDEFVAFPEYLDLAPFLAPKRDDYGLGASGKTSSKEAGKDTERCMYRLYAVVQHIGNMLGGHYVAYTALPPSQSLNNMTSAQASETEPEPGASTSTTQSQATPSENKTKSDKTQRQWAYISDTVVRLTTLEEVLKAKAYICMYERI